MSNTFDSHTWASSACTGRRTSRRACRFPTARATTTPRSTGCSRRPPSRPTRRAGARPRRVPAPHRARSARICVLATRQLHHRRPPRARPHGQRRRHRRQPGWCVDRHLIDSERKPSHDHRHHRHHRPPRRALVHPVSRAASPLGIAARQGWLAQTFAEEGIAIESIIDSKDRSIRESHST